MSQTMPPTSPKDDVKEVWHCNVCNTTVLLRNRPRHEDSKTHKDKLQNLGNAGVSLRTNSHVAAGSSNLTPSPKPPTSCESDDGPDRWHCDVCNTSVLVKGRARHEESKTHQEKLLKNSTSKGASKQTPSPQPPRSGESDDGPDRWHCDVCNTSVLVKGRARHEESKTHQEKLLKNSTSKDNTAGASKQTPSPQPPRSGESDDGPDRWHCDVCNTSLLLKSRARHEESKTHQEKLLKNSTSKGASKQTPSPQPPRSGESDDGPDRWHCDVCNTSVLVKGRARHEESKTHQEKLLKNSTSKDNTAGASKQTPSPQPPRSGESDDGPDRWHCDVCNTSLLLKSRARHEESKTHQEKLLKDSTSKGASKQTPSPQPPRSGESDDGPDRWHCDVCNTSVLVKGRARHEESKTHQEKLLKTSSSKDKTAGASKQTPSPQPSRSGESDDSPDRWHCDVCNTSVLVKGRARHEESKTHQEKLLKKSFSKDNTAGASKQTPSPQPPRSGESDDGPDRWHCDVCNTSVLVKGRARHEESKTHQEKLLKKSFSKDNTAGASKQTPSPQPPRSVESDDGPDRWHCDVCNTSVLVKGRARHEESKTHQEKLKILAVKETKREYSPLDFAAAPPIDKTQWSRDSASPVESNRQDKWFCDLCKTWTKNRETHELNKTHQLNLNKNNTAGASKQTPSPQPPRSSESDDGPDRWHCDVCNTSVLVKNRARHEESKTHQEKLKILAVKETKREYSPLDFAAAPPIDKTQWSSDSASPVESNRQDKWFCDLCKTWTKNRATHELNKTHQLNLNKNPHVQFDDRPRCIPVTDDILEAVVYVRGEAEEKLDKASAECDIDYSLQNEQNEQKELSDETEVKTVQPRRSLRLQDKEFAIVKSKLEEPLIQETMQYNILNPSVVSSLAASDVFSNEDAERLKQMYINNDYFKAIEKMIDLILTSQCPGKWRALLEALEENGYDYLVKLLKNEKSPSHINYADKMIQKFSNQLEKNINVNDILFEIYSGGFISDVDMERIMCVHKNNGLCYAMMELLIRMKKLKSPDEWYRGFLSALMVKGYSVIVEQMEPDFAKDFKK